MEEEFIDVHRSQARYSRANARFAANARITEPNKALIGRFLREAALGKTVIGRAKKKIGSQRLVNYLKHFEAMADYLPADLESASMEEMENLVQAIEGDQIRSRSMRVIGGRAQTSGALLSPQYKVDLKVTLKKFYKWLQGNNRAYPELVEWIDTYIQHREIPALSAEEVGSLVDRAGSVMDRALIQVLFDGGFRIGELLNIRLRHVRYVRLDPDDPDARCFVVRVPFSKTIRRTVTLPMQSTTRWLSVWLEDHPAGPEIKDDGTLRAADTGAQLFPVSVPTCQKHLQRLGQRVLGKTVYPHLLRHSSATYWSNRLSYFQQCKRFGWSMTSKMPQRYIDRQGVDELGVALQHLRAERGAVGIPDPPLLTAATAREPDSTDSPP